MRRMRQTTLEAWSDFAEGRHSDQYMLVLLAAVFGAISLLFDGSIDVLPPGRRATAGSGTVTFADFLDTTFAYLRSGF